MVTNKRLGSLITVIKRASTVVMSGFETWKNAFRK